jgi:peptide/nickel transport system substrate-binding protein
MLMILSLLITACGGGSGTPAGSTTTPSTPGDSSGSKSDLADKQDVVIGVGAEATTMDPRHATDVASQNIVNLVYAPLVELDDATVSIVPVVAKNWENPDDRTYIFHLRDDVRFHDGTPLTAHDVKYTFDTLRDPDFGARNLSLYSPIVELEAVDDHTVKFVLDEPNAAFLNNLTVGIVPKHIAEKNGDDFFTTTGLGAGPFKFEKWDQGERIILVANDDYFDGRPTLNRVTFRPIPELTSRVLEVETGGVDAIDDIQPIDVTRLEADASVAVTRAPATGFTYMGLHNGNKPFDDIRVRQAIGYAIDRALIIDHVFMGTAQVAYTPIIPNSWAHEKDVNPFSYDMAKAKQLLADAGYPNGFDVTLDLSQNPVRRQIAEILQEEFKQLGINMSIREREWGAFYQDVVDGKVTMYILGWVGQTDPDGALYRQFHSKNLPPAGANRQAYKNAEVDELLELGRTTIDQEERKQIYSEAQKIIVEEASYVYLAYTEIMGAQNPKLKNFQRSGWNYFKGLREAYLVK